MAFPPQFLDEIRARLSCSEVIGRRVRLVKKGREHSGLCPFHNEKTPSFTVNDDKGFFHCFAGETNVITREGMAPISSLSGKTAVVLTRGGKWVNAPFRAYGKQKLYRIDLSRNGVPKTLYATSGHRWFVRGRKSAVVTTDLRAGHRLEAVLPQSRDEWTLDPRAVQHGVVFGDGTVQRKGDSGYGTVNLHGEKAADLAAWFAAYNPSERFREGGIEYVRVYGGRDFEHMKSLPPLDEGDDYLLGFLAGYLAADGHVAKDGTVMLHCVDPAVLRWVRDAATRLGIGTFGMTRQKRRGYLANEEPIHRIHFVASTLSPAMLLRKEARRRWKKANKTFERLRWAVRSVKPTDRVEEVYCATVSEHHAFALEDNILTGNCFGCGAHGDVIGFTMRIDHLPFPEAVERLAGEAGLDMPQQSPADRARAEVEQTLHDVVEAACVWFETQLRAPAGAAGLNYLRGRGLDDETIKRFRLGYAPEQRTGLRSALLAKGFKEAQLVQASLLFKPDDGRDSFDFFRDRVIFPIADRRGRVIAFGGRVLGDGQPKYLNSRDTPLFDKGRTLYAMDKAREGARKGAEVVVAEGYMDVIALHAAGFAGAVAPLGTALTEAQIEQLWKMAPEPVICLDGDAAGQRAALRAAERAMPLLKAGHSLRFATLPAGEDPDSLIRHEGPPALQDVLAKARPLVDVVWESETAGREINTPERRAALTTRLEQRVRLIADRTVQDQYRSIFRDRMWNSLRTRRPPYPGRGRQAGPGQPAAGLRAPGDVRTLVLRQAQVVLATLVNHPALIFEEFETIGQIELPAGDLDSIRQEILNVASQNPDLDSLMLKNQFKEAGLAHALTGLSEPSLYKLWPFAGPEAAMDEARAGWRHVASLFQRRQLESEVRAARNDLGRDMTEESWARLDALQRQAREASSADWDEDDPLASGGWAPPGTVSTRT